MQTAPDHVLLACVILELPDARSAWRRTRVRVRLAHWAPAGFRDFDSSFDSSFLRFFGAPVLYIVLAD
jgi:hypothetical protein